MAQGIKYEMDWNKLEAFMHLGAKLRDCAELLHVSGDTIVAKIKERYNLSFEEYREDKLSVTRMKLVQKAFELAAHGNVTMLIFCLKNMNEWTDKRELDHKSSDGTMSPQRPRVNLATVLSKEDLAVLEQMKQKLLANVQH